MAAISRKITMVGDFSVGKTSLIRRYVEGNFSDKYLSTVGVKISRRSLELPGAEGAMPQAVQLIIWDLEGQTKYKAIAPTYLQGSKGAIIVADITREETIESIASHVKLYRSVSKDSAIAIALNKVDLAPNDIATTLAQIEQKYGSDIIKAYPTSAKDGKNVESLFVDLAATTLT